MFSKNGPKLDRLIALAEEHNALLRELVTTALGRQPATRKPVVGPIRKSTAKDVVVITQADRRRMQADAEAELEAHWRKTRASGPDSETTSTPPTSKSAAAKSDGLPRD